MCYAGKGLLERIEFALTHVGPLTVDEIATKTARVRGSVHPALNVLRHQGRVRRYGQIMVGRPGRPRIVYQMVP